MSKVIDEVGKQYNKVKVINFDSWLIRNNGGRKAIWKCLCECGKYCKVLGDDLRSGKRKSCGCVRAESVRNSLRKKAKYSGLIALYKQYQNRAKHKYLEFKLTKKEFELLTKSNCYYCNKEPKQIAVSGTYSEYMKTKSKYLYNGIDRMNSDDGYILSNVVACCGQCNRAKSNVNFPDFQQWVKQVYKIFIKNERSELSRLISEAL